MEPNRPSQTLETPDTQSQSPEDQPQQPLELTKTLPIASISLSLSSLLSPQLLLSSPKKPSLYPFSHLKIPSHISSLSHLSLFSTSPQTLLQSLHPLSHRQLLAPFPLLPPPPPHRDPSHSAVGRHCTVVWFRTDLHVHDNEAINTASNNSLSLLPIYLFDPRDYGKSSFDFDKIGPYRASFLLQSVADLHSILHARGSDLVV